MTAPRRRKEPPLAQEIERCVAEKAAKRVLDILRLDIDFEGGRILVALDDGDGGVLAVRDVTDDVIEVVVALLLSKKDEGRSGAGIVLTDRETGGRVTLGAVVHDPKGVALGVGKDGAWN